MTVCNLASAKHERKSATKAILLLQSRFSSAKFQSVDAAHDATYQPWS
jgi:hypothetical protein